MDKSGNIIKTRLKTLKKTQGWLAAIAGVSINAVSKWTKGEPIARKNVMVVADALGITADQLLKGTQGGAESRSSLVELSAIERRILALYNGTSDRGKLDMISSIEEIAKDVEEQRRRSESAAQRAENPADEKGRQLGLVDHPPIARRKS